MRIFSYFILFVVWGILDLVNLFLVYENFFAWKRKRQKKNNLFFIIYYFLITILFAYAAKENSKIGCLILYIPFYLKAVPVINCYFKKQKIQILIVTVLLYNETIAFLGQTAFFIIGSKIGEVQHISWSRNLVDVSISLLLLILIIFMLELKKNNFVSIYLQNIPFRIYFILCIVVYCMGIVEDGLFVGQNITGADLSFTRIFAVILMFFLCLLIFEIIKINQQKVSTDKIADFMVEQMKGMAEYYNELSKKETELHRFRHDVKNLLIVLHSMIEQQHYEKALEYIEKMEMIYRATTRGFDTGNIIADALLNTKMHIAEEYNTKIVFEGFVPAQQIEDLDLSILLSNILDNAIEACQKIEGKKEIRIESVLVKKMWMLTVKNPVKTDVMIRDNKIRTSKEDKETHGYGIINMKKVVERYCGNLQLTCDNGEFITKANLSLGAVSLRQD